MNNLQHRQQKIQEKRKQTPWREFVMEIVSLRSFSLYKSNNLTSIFPQTERIRWIVSHDEFEEYRDKLVGVLGEIDYSQPFFDIYKKLWDSVNLPPTILFGSCENANFSDQTVSSKNCYLSYVVIRDCEDVLYSVSVKEGSKNILNSLMVRDWSDTVFYSKGIISSFSVFYSHFITNSSNIWFSSNLVWCTECVGCQNLDNQSYCIKNKKYAKEEYLRLKKQLLAQQQKFSGWQQWISHNGLNRGSESIVHGNANIQSDNLENAYMNYQVSEGRNTILVWGKLQWERVYDAFLQTPPESDIYGVFSTGYGSHIYLSHQIKGWSVIFYSYLLDECSFCLGCIGLKNKSYCIFNKQYTKEERHQKVEIIFWKMENEWILWNFFPWSLNPFYFNDTAASLIEDFTKEEVEAQWYLRRDEELAVDIPDRMDVVKSEELATYESRIDGVWTIDPTILKKVIKDEAWNVYRIIKMEYDFLVKHWLPLPRKHWLDRLKWNFRLK